jgi:hypothetical protein
VGCAADATSQTAPEAVDETTEAATKTYTVGGTVSGLAGSGLVLADGTSTVAIAKNGAFVFPTKLKSGAAYAVTVKTEPSSPAQTCAVTNGKGTVKGNVTSVKVTCTSSTYTVGGTVVGLAGSGLVLADGNGDSLAIAANGAFTFPTKLATGMTYSVTVSTQPTSPWQTCMVTNGNGTVGAANFTNVAVTCVLNTYPVIVDVTAEAPSCGQLALSDGFASLDASGMPYDTTKSFAFPPLASGQHLSLSFVGDSLCRCTTDPNNWTSASNSGTFASLTITSSSQVVALHCAGLIP